MIAVTSALFANSNFSGTEGSTARNEMITAMEEALKDQIKAIYGVDAPEDVPLEDPLYGSIQPTDVHGVPVRN